MNPDLDKLQAYPHERLAQLKADCAPTAVYKAINLSIGEPQHPVPAIVQESLVNHLAGLGQYPGTKGTADLRSAIAAWLQNRFILPVKSLDPDRHILPVNGTREALFAFAQTVVDRNRPQAPIVIMPNPFYQIYEGAAIMAGAEPWFINTTESTAHLPDFSTVPEAIWQRCQLLYICTPGNPSGAMMSLPALQALIERAERYDFIIASDECYSELYDESQSPPPGLLEAAIAGGNADFRRCIVFHSLSKRSSVPGLRSGFVAGDAAVLRQFLLYRTYHGGAMSLPIQAASGAAWRDENHVRENRRLYREKFDAVIKVLRDIGIVRAPAGGFYLWLETPICDVEFTRLLYQNYNLLLLPGSYLSRDAHGINPGRRRVRIALVAGIDDCVEAARRIRSLWQTL